MLIPLRNGNHFPDKAADFNTSPFDLFTFIHHQANEQRVYFSYSRAGTTYAHATALRMSQHIRGRIHLLAPWILPSQMNVFGAQVASPPVPLGCLPFLATKSGIPKLRI
jgi:hypothetical protein